LPDGLYSSSIVENVLHRDYSKEEIDSQDENILYQQNDEPTFDDKIDEKGKSLIRSLSFSSSLTDRWARFRSPTLKSEENKSNPVDETLSTWDPSIEDILSKSSFNFDLFSQNHLFHPYLSIHSLSMISDRRIRSFFIGSSNQLFRLDEKSLDFIFDDQIEDFQILSSQLKVELQLTTADLRFVQSFENSSTKEILAEEQLRRLFVEYFLSLLSVSHSSNSDLMEDFNLHYVRSFQRTNVFQSWKRKSSSTDFISTLGQKYSRHPQSGQLNVNDVKLRVSQVFDESQTGRKMRDAFQETSEFIGEKSRSAGKIFEQAKNSFLSSFIRTFQQDRQTIDDKQIDQHGEKDEGEGEDEDKDETR